MKHILLAFLLTSGSAAFAQITNDSILGTWVTTDINGRETKLIIAGDSVTMVFSSQTAPGRTEWTTATHVMHYTIEQGDSLRIDDSYYKIVHTRDGNLQIEGERISKDGNVKVIYRRE